MTAAAILAFCDGDSPAGDADASALMAAAARSPLDQINAILDTPILDANERGGPLEPVKRWIRAEPELAQVVASITALSFFAAFGVVFGRAASGTLF